MDDCGGVIMLMATISQVDNKNTIQININGGGWTTYDVVKSAWPRMGYDEFVNVADVDILTIGNTDPFFSDTLPTYTAQFNVHGAKGFHLVTGPYDMSGLIPMTQFTVQKSNPGMEFYIPEIGAYVGYTPNSAAEELLIVW